MGSAILFLASQALALTAPATGASPPPGARLAAIATAEILHAETTREEPGPQRLNRHRRVNAEGRASIEFE